MIIKLELDLQLAEHQGPIRLHARSLAATADGDPALASLAFAKPQPTPSGEVFRPTRALGCFVPIPNVAPAPRERSGA
jgi:hypothetical protein